MQHIREKKSALIDIKFLLTHSDNLAATGNPFDGCNY